MGGQLERLDRRGFMRWTAERARGIGALGTVSVLLAACAREVADRSRGEGPTSAGGSPSAEPTTAGGATVGDVVDYALSSEDWEGAFGFVTLRLHAGSFDGGAVYFIRTDTSDESFAEQQGLVWAPKLASLVQAGAAGDLYLVEGGVAEQAAVLSSEPGREDYTPAWRVHRVTWNGAPEMLSSVGDVERARGAGSVDVEPSDIVVNAPVVKWTSGEMPVDGELREYLGGGQLVEAVDASGMKVTFKLHECFPESRYIVVDTSLAPMADGMRVAHSPRLASAHDAEATGRTNVFMNGIEGPGPMGFQPSVFDSRAGDAEWSPYWDHMTYAWGRGVTARVLPDEPSVHRARDAGELDEFPGTPDTDGEVFTVNCPVPVVAPNTFSG
ncbi:MAG: hypothetical protein HY658_04105 [Actinobacteria bacterium]|nr:hypothetical protein [Actinomycetota bacterium]